MTGHLGREATAYVDRQLAPAVLAAYDRHVVVCPACRYAAEAEQRLLTALRATPAPGVPPALQSMLMGLGAARPDGSGPGGAADVPQVPQAPPSVRAMRLPTVAPAAPAQHRSPRRAAFLAGLAAGASAAAAWGLAVSVAPTAQPIGPVARPNNPSVLQGSLSASTVLSFNTATSPTVRSIFPGTGETARAKP